MKARLFPFVVLLCSLPSAASALNPPVAAEPTRDTRTLLVADVSCFETWTPAVTAGGIFQVSLGRSEITHGPDCGNACITPPEWYLHVGASGGILGSTDRYAALGAIGLVQRPGPTSFLAPSFITSRGMVVQSLMPDKAIGPAVRIELMDNIGLQVGALKLIDRRPIGFFLSIDLMACLLRDLGFEKTCGSSGI